MSNLTAVSFVLKQINVSSNSVSNTLQLLQEGATVPFISRYRKEATGNLDEVEIQKIKDLYEEFLIFDKRKEAILKSLTEQGVLTEKLNTAIANAANLLQLEDLYLPYKKKKLTKATKAKQAGLEPLAKIIMAQREDNLEKRASGFLNGTIKSTAHALEGAQHIIAEWISEHTGVRNALRRLFDKEAELQSKLVSKFAANPSAYPEITVFEPFFDYKESLKKCPSHRLLAVMRAEKEGAVRLKVAVSKEKALAIIARYFDKNASLACSEIIEQALSDSYRRLLAPSIANECLQQAKLKADQVAINVFAVNLKQLLLEAPLGGKRVLALDPGFKSGCKLVCLDAQGNLLYHTNIYPHAPQNKTTEASAEVNHLIGQFQIEAIAIGNGTASRETEAFVKHTLKSIINSNSAEVAIFIVNESGASIYSASEVAREEFPELDVTVRGAISIGRRLMDPLAELVKIDPKSLGVGQYQHDVNATLLQKELEQTVVHCVNLVGVNVNTASQSLLSYVSGIGPKLAANIVAYRKEHQGISSRKELTKVKGLGTKALQQCAAFLRVTNSANPLDNSAIHPERYALVEQIAKDNRLNVLQLIGNTEAINKIAWDNYASETVGLLTLNDIKTELQKPGIDPRSQRTAFAFDENIKQIEDLHVGMKVLGIVNNITNFGCFVDIGIKQSGLIHISKLAKSFVQDINSVIKLNQEVQATVIDVDVSKKRIQLSLVE